MNETFMKEKPILPLLTSMALPMVISMMVNALYNIVDSLFVARINENAMTALSLVFPIQNFVNALAIGFGVGINALIAYFLGAGDKKGSRPRRHTGTCSGTHPRRCRHCVKHLHHAGFPGHVHQRCAGISDGNGVRGDRICVFDNHHGESFL